MATPPNIVLILADDQGYGDVSCLNPDARLRTPRLDRLAAGGMTFTDAHSNSAVCTPTRYGVLTGRYAWRGRLQKGVLYGYSGPLIEPGRATLASLLGGRGYATACIGKWHLGLGWRHGDGSAWTDSADPGRVDFAQPLSAGPHTVGFDRSFIIPASLDMDPYCYIEDGRVVERPTARTARSERPAFWREGAIAPGFEHGTCLLEFTLRAEAFINECARARPRRPFFLYFPTPSPHTPHMPRPPFRGASRAGVYGDYVVEHDWSIGRVLDALERNGLLDDTLVIATSDNGCHCRGKGFDLEAEFGHRGNHIYRGQKSDAWDGGHRVPFLAAWRGRIAPGSACTQTVCLTDLLATAAEAAGAPVPAGAGEDSVSLLPLLTGRAGGPAREAVVHHSIAGAFALRRGRWKYVECPGSGGWSLPDGDVPPDRPRVQLYDMQSDPGEQANLADRCPDVAAEMQALLDRIRGGAKPA